MNQGLTKTNLEGSLITKIVHDRLILLKQNSDRVEQQRFKRKAFALTICGVTAKIAVSGRNDQQKDKCLVESTIDQEFYNRSVK